VAFQAALSLLLLDGLAHPLCLVGIFRQKGALSNVFVEAGGIVMFRSTHSCEFVLLDFLVRNGIQRFTLDGVINAHELTVVAAAVRTLNRHFHLTLILLLRLAFMLWREVLVWIEALFCSCVVLKLSLLLDHAFGVRHALPDLLSNLVVVVRLLGLGEADHFVPFFCLVRLVQLIVSRLHARWIFEAK